MTFDRFNRNEALNRDKIVAVKWKKASLKSDFWTDRFIDTGPKLIWFLHYLGLGPRPKVRPIYWFFPARVTISYVSGEERAFRCKSNAHAEKVFNEVLQVLEEGGKLAPWSYISGTGAE